MSPALNPPTQPALRTAVQALLQFQAGTAADGLPGWPAEHAAALLAPLPAWCATRSGRPWTDAEQALWQRVQAALVASALAQPRVALQGNALAGPLTHDLAALLRNSGMPEDDTAELDLAVRWWEGARRAGLPVDADFGEVWRAFEWLGLLRHLALLPAAIDATSEAALLAAACKVALRYGPLKPLLRLLPAPPEAAVGAGYTF